MADYKHIIPFIKQIEGGWVDNKLDAGGETNKGITYRVWCSVFGNNAHDRFMAMSDDDWAHIFKSLYWDAVWGDKINSQRIADQLVDLGWGSGTGVAVKTIQSLLVSLGHSIVADGVMGDNTLNALNTSDEKQLFKALCLYRVKFLAHIPINNPSQKVFIDGWLNRQMNLIFNQVTL